MEILIVALLVSNLGATFFAYKKLSQSLSVEPVVFYPVERVCENISDPLPPIEEAVEPVPVPVSSEYSSWQNRSNIPWNEANQRAPLPVVSQPNQKPLQRPSGFAL